jgi:hypothetical protein
MILTTLLQLLLGRYHLHNWHQILFLAMTIESLPFELWERILGFVLPSWQSRLHEVNSTFKELVFQWKYYSVELRPSGNTTASIQRILAHARYNQLSVPCCQYLC